MRVRIVKHQEWVRSIIDAFLGMEFEVRDVRADAASSSASATTGHMALSVTLA